MAGRALITVKQKRNFVGGVLVYGGAGGLQKLGFDPLAIAGYFIGAGLLMKGANEAHGREDAAYITKHG